jgi:LuxR family maltose regulon positive regulatory protein
MAKSAATASAGAVASARDVLLATKQYVPSVPPGFVPRARLVGRLDEGLARGVVLVCAPAGFGKTTLLADWARGGRRSVAWLALDVDESDPARFWRYVVAALDRVRSGIAERVGALLGPPAPVSFDGVATALINELAAQPGELVLILDDYHLVDAPAVHASLTFLLEHLPPGLRVVLAGRSDPPLRLARLRARGRLAELRAAELRFTAQEAAGLLREAVGPELPDTALTALVTRTEGWVAGLQLAGLSLRGQADAAGLVASFSGSHRYVLDYLSQEVLESQPEPVREFLLETSVLPRLCGELCDALTGRRDGQQMLEAIEGANLFLVPLDSARGWWRYHHLFADLLQARLQRQRPERVPELHRRAAAWSDEHGLTDDAVRHALAAGEATWAARLIERYFDELFYLRGEGATVQRWLAALPAELVDSRPRLLTTQAALAAASGRLEVVDGLLDAAERTLPGTVDEPFEPSAGKAASLLVNLAAMIPLVRAYLAELRGDAEPAFALGSQALAEVREGEWMLGCFARGYLAVAEWLRGRLPEAESELSATITQWRAAGEHSLAVRGCHYLGEVQRAQGRPDAALGTYRQALEITAPPGRPTLPAAGVAYVGLAEVAYQRGDLDTALRQVSQGITLCRQLTNTQPLANGLATLAWIRQVMGDPVGALQAIDEAEQAAVGPDVASLLNPVPARRARLLLVQGDLTAVAEWTRQRGLDVADQPRYAQEPDHLVLARVLLAQHLPEQALTLLQRLHTAATSQRRTGSLIEIQALQALALSARGEDASAVATLTRTLTMAHPRGFIRVLADEGAPMRTLLDRLTAARRAARPSDDDIPPNYLARLRLAFDRTPTTTQPGHGAAVPGLIEPLTARERQVLDLLAAGWSNSRIAEHLVVTLDTVKKHVSRILDKLGAANRTEAVAKARRLDLIS